MWSLLRNFVIVSMFLHASGITASDLFEDNSILEMQLRGPLSSLIQSKKQKKSFPFVLTVNGHSQEVLLRARGNSRIRVCKFPPLRLQFRQIKSSGSVFSDFDKLKIVTHCRNTSAAQDYALKEYLAYKIFNQFTDTSYRVRMTRISYINTEAQRDSEPLIRYAFIIEPRLAMTRRLGARPVKTKGVTLASLNKEHMAQVYVFQYLIGNTDWSLVTSENDRTCCHNGSLLDMNNQRFYIPFDFDLSGLVNARYAFPDASLRIKRVTRRLYRGFCLSPELLLATLEDINKKETAIITIANNLPGLSEKKQNKINKFIGGFFAESKNSRRLANKFEQKCL